MFTRALADIHLWVHLRSPECASKYEIYKLHLHTLPCDKPLVRNQTSSVKLRAGHAVDDMKPALP